MAQCAAMKNPLPVFEDTKEMGGILLAAAAPPEVVAEEAAVEPEDEHAASSVRDAAATIHTALERYRDIPSTTFVASSNVGTADNLICLGPGPS
jgi:hypothetical protein